MNGSQDFGRGFRLALRSIIDEHDGLALVRTGGRLNGPRGVQEILPCLCARLKNQDASGEVTCACRDVALEESDRVGFPAKGYARVCSGGRVACVLGRAGHKQFLLARR